MERETNRQTERQRERQMNKMERQRPDKWIDRETLVTRYIRLKRHLLTDAVTTNHQYTQRDRQTHRQRQRQTDPDKETDRPRLTERQKDRETERQRQTDRQTAGQTCGGVDGSQQCSFGVPIEVGGAISHTVPHVIHHEGQVLQGRWHVRGEGFESHSLIEVGEERSRERSGERVVPLVSCISFQNSQRKPHVPHHSQIEFSHCKIICTCTYIDLRVYTVRVNLIDQ